MKFCFITLFLPLLLVGCSSNEAPASLAAKPPATAKIEPATTATISGVVTFDGNPPNPQPIDMSQDPACVMGRVPPTFGEAYSISKSRVQNVFVYIKDGLGNYVYPKPAPATLDQHGCHYVPHVLGMMVGQKLRILNSDPTLHNIHSMANVNDGWNVSQYPGGQAIEQKFDKPELMVPIQCNNHPWMKMYVNVVTNPFFAVTDANGKFSITGLPPGTYTLAALHEKMGEKTMQMTIAQNNQQPADFQFGSRDIK